MSAALGAAPGAAVEAADGAGSAPPRPPRILVVDDEPINVAILRRMLKRCGHDCAVAGSGFEAVERTAAEPCDLVLMDISMPGMDGVTAASEIARRLGPAGPAVIAVTANVTTEQRQACQAAGFVDFVPKPVSLDALRAALGRVAPAA